MRKLLVGVLAALLLAGCTPPPAPTSSVETPISFDGGTPLTLDTLPRMDGSTANIPLAVALVQRLTGCTKEEAEEWVHFNTTPVAYNNMSFEDETAPQLLLAYEADADTKENLELNSVELETTAIGKDALVFVANAANPVTSLTTKQIQDIYTGQITNWKDVGGEDKEIVAYQRPETSGSQAMMRKLIMGDTEFAEAPKELVSEAMAGLIEGVASYANTGNALGYSVYYYVDRMLAKPELKLLAVDGVEPSPETIRSGEYPHVNEFFAVVRADEPEGSPARRIVAWLQTDEGQKLIGDAGYVGVGSAKVAQGSAGPSEGGGDLALTDSSPMLWLLTQRSSNSWETLRERYGFISSTGKVSAKQYLNYAYCADNGRPTRAVATKGDSVDILGLDGEVQKALKHRYAYSLTCIANRFVVAYGNPTYEFISDPPLVYDLEKGSELTVPSFLEVSFEGRRGYSSRTLLDYVVSLAEPGRPFCMSDDVVGNEGAPDRQLDVDGNPVGTNTDCEPSDFVEPIPYCVDDKGQTHSNVPICLDWSELTDDGQVRLAWMGTLVPTGRIAQVKQGGFQGLKDADGKWVFKESSFQEFED